MNAKFHKHGANREHKVGRGFMFDNIHFSALLQLAFLCKAGFCALPSHHFPCGQVLYSLALLVATHDDDRRRTRVNPLMRTNEGGIVGARRFAYM